MKIEAKDIVNAVRWGDRTKAELERCGCDECKKALKILEGSA